MTVDGTPVQKAASRPAAYVAPISGWQYKPLKVGDRLRAAFYQPRYVVAAPVGLPAAGTGRCWVRYGENLVLVSVRGGRVLRVVGGRYL